MTRFHLIQSDLAWEDAATNREQLTAAIASADPGRGDVVVLPEMFSTGFSMASERLAETMSGDTVRWLKEMAESTAAFVCGSVIIEEDGEYFNRFLCHSPEGLMASYNKRHLFRMSGEHKHYSPGTSQPVFRAGEFSVLPQVCYDLRFPVWSRNRGRYDVLLFVANWPDARREHWLALLKARAIENLSYVIAVNRVGTDGNGISYSGDSCCFGPDGGVLLQMGEKAGTASVTLDQAALRAYREAFPAHLDADAFELSEPAPLASDA